jgi:hypothetical protein
LDFVVNSCFKLNLATSALVSVKPLASHLCVGQVKGVAPLWHKPEDAHDRFPFVPMSLHLWVFCAKYLARNDMGKLVGNGFVKELVEVLFEQNRIEPNEVQPMVSHARTAAL